MESNNGLPQNMPGRKSKNENPSRESASSPGLESGAS
jgi:hypothetical protein